MMNWQPDKGELCFSPDFAERVVAQADGIRGRRRMAGFGAGASVAISVGIVSLFLPGTTRPPTRAPAVTVAAAVNKGLDLSGNTPTDPLQFLFPEAVPVARFADTYSEATYGREGRPGELLLADDVEETGDP